MFFRATWNDCHAIRHVLDSYLAISGQVINLEKSYIWFSPNIADEEVADLKHILGIGSVNDLDVYLGLPAFMDRSKWIAF